MAILYSGTEGTCQWTIDDEGHLYIGSGVISHNTTSYSDWGWHSYRNEIISVSSGNVSWAIGANACSMFYMCQNLTSLDLSNFDTSNVTNMNQMFYYCNSLISLDLSSFDTSNVTDMSYMFYNCQSLISLDLSNFDTSNVTSMYCMFSNCRFLTSLDLLNFNTSNVTNMNTMFANCQSLTSLDLSNFNTSNVTNMGSMFSYCQSLTLLNLSSFDTSNVTSMGSMFYSCRYLTSLNLSSFDTSKVTSMDGMFGFCQSLKSLDLSSFSTSNVTSMYSMFARCSNLKWIGVSNLWNISKVTYSTNMFDTCTSLHGGAGTTYNSSAIDVSMAHIDEGESNPGYLVHINNTEMYASFDSNNGQLTIFRDVEGIYDSFGTGETIGSITYWSGIENITGSTSPKWYNIANNIIAINIINKFRPKTSAFLFAECNQLTSLDLSNLDVGDLTSTSTMFYNCEALTTLSLPNFNVGQLTSTSYMFYNCSSLVSLNLSNFDTSNVVNMESMFKNCQALTSLNLLNFNTSKVILMSSMFYGCQSLTSLDLSNFDTSNVINMNSMFYRCHSLTLLNLSSFDTSNVTNMNSMFYFCYALTSLDLSNFNTSKVTNMSYMFDNCQSLTSLDLSNFDTSNVTNMNSMFYLCYALTSLDVSSFDTSNVTDMSYMFHFCYVLASLDLSNFDTSNVTNMNGMFYGCHSLISLNLSNFDTSNVTNMNNMFLYCSALTSLNLSSFDTSNVTSMSYMFDSCNSLTSLDLSNFDTSNVTDMGSMFGYCRALTSLDLSNFDTSNVTDMGSMFHGCSTLKWIAVSNLWNTNKITTSSQMFDGCTVLRGGAGTSYNSSSTDVSMAHIDGGQSNPGYLSDFMEQLKAFAEFDSSTGQLTIFRDIYDAYTDGEEIGTKVYWADIEAREDPADEVIPAWEMYAEDISTVNIIHKFRPKTGLSMFAGCELLTSLDLTNLDTSDMNVMVNMFGYCRALTSLDLSNFDTSNVTTMDQMFYDCSNLISLDLSGFNTSNVTSMVSMFQNCEQLTSLNLTSFNTSNVIYMFWMFVNCGSLTSLNLSSFNMAKVISMAYMFMNCTSLATLTLNLSNATAITSMISCFDGCAALTTVPFIPPSITQLTNCFKGCTSLTGDIHTTCIPTTYNGCFTDTVEKINLVYDSPTIPAIWKTIADTYDNVYLGTIVGDYLIQEVDDIYNINQGTKVFSAKVVDKTKTSYQPLPQYIQIDRTLYDILDYTSCFENCTSLVEAPIIISNALILNSCFKGCVNLQGRIPIITWIGDGEGQIIDDYRHFDNIFTDTVKPIKLCIIDLKTDDTCDFDDDPWKQMIDSGIYSNVSLWDVTTGIIDFLPGAEDYNITLLSEEDGIWNITVSSTNKTTYGQTPTPEAIIIPILINGIPYSQVEFNECFKGCSNITNLPDHCISRTTTQMNECFKGCTSLIKAPLILSEVVEMNECFSGCQSLQGNIVIYNNPTAANHIFNGTSNQIYIVNKAAPTRSIGNTSDETWRIIARLYQNVHYGYDDYIPPSVEFAAKRVATSDSEDEMVSGEYVFMQLNYTDSSPTLPDGWYTTQEIQNCTINNINQSVDWYHNNNTFKGWNLVDLYETTIAVTMVISFKDENDSVKGTIEIEVTGGLEEVYRLVDFLAGGKGVAFGKVAENEGFDNTLKTIFRNEILFEIDNNDSVWKTTEEKNLENMILNGINSEYWL